MANRSTFEFLRVHFKISRADSPRCPRICGVDIKSPLFKLLCMTTHRSLKCCKVSFDRLPLIRSKNGGKIICRFPKFHIIWDIQKRPSSCWWSGMNIQHRCRSMRNNPYCFLFRNESTNCFMSACSFVQKAGMSIYPKSFGSLLVDTTMLL